MSNECKFLIYYSSSWKRNEKNKSARQKELRFQLKLHKIVECKQDVNFCLYIEINGCTLAAAVDSNMQREKKIDCETRTGLLSECVCVM